MSISQSQTILFNVLTPVRLCSTSNVSGSYYNGPSNNGIGATLTIAASSLTIDSVLAKVGDRILLQNQTNAYQNGIYIVKTIEDTVILQRADDQQSVEQLKSGQFTIVGAGSIEGGSIYALTEPLPNVIGVDSFVWVASSVNSGGLSATLPSTQLYVGSSGNVATAVNLSGDATLSNTGVLTISDSAITTSKIDASAVTLTKLASVIAPAYVVKFGGKNSSAGGSATVVISASGVLATDLVFAQIESSVNVVNVQKVTPTANTITVLCSGDPGAATITFQALRAAS